MEYELRDLCNGHLEKKLHPQISSSPSLSHSPPCHHLLIPLLLLLFLFPLLLLFLLLLLLLLQNLYHLTRATALVTFPLLEQNTWYNIKEESFIWLQRIPVHGSLVLRHRDSGRARQGTAAQSTAAEKWRRMWHQGEECTLPGHTLVTTSNQAQPPNGTFSIELLNRWIHRCDNKTSPADPGMQTLVYHKTPEQSKAASSASLLSCGMTSSMGQWSFPCWNHAKSPTEEGYVGHTCTQSMGKETPHYMWEQKLETVNY